MVKDTDDIKSLEQVSNALLDWFKNWPSTSNTD